MTRRPGVSKRCPNGFVRKPRPVGGSETLSTVSAILGYARISTADQSPDLQRDALNAAGCFRVWMDTASGARTDRPELAAVMDALRPGTPLWCGVSTGLGAVCRI